jgi:biotin-dependent carboxylase-like uncharacterized protein
MRLEVVRPGLLSTLQDRGRRGYESLGISIGGVLDDYAAAFATRLAGNRPEAAVLEMTLQGPELLVREGGLLALAGADLAGRVNGSPWSPGSTVMVRPGDVVRFGAARRGLRGYLAAPGGFAGDRWLHSRSTDLLLGRGGMGGRALMQGDHLESPQGLAPDEWTRVTHVGTAVLEGPLRILPADGAADAPDILSATAFHVAPRADRVGLRLAERVEKLARDAARRGAAGGTGLSEGMAMGSVEVTPGGEVIVLLKSRGTVGGYFVPAHVIRADWPRLAQLRPGESVRFAAVSREMADGAWAHLRMRLALSLEPVPPGVPAAACSAVPGRVVRTVAAGTRVAAGDTIWEIATEGGTTAISAAVDGPVVYSVARGAEVAAHDPVGWIVG